MHPFPSLHPHCDECTGPIEHHPLTECQLRCTLRLHVHRAFIQFVQLVSVLLTCTFFGRGLLEDVLCGVQENVEVREVEALVNHLLDLLLGLGRELATIYVFAFLWVVVHFLAAIISILIGG
jgi:hypothetical protein